MGKKEKLVAVISVEHKRQWCQEGLQYRGYKTMKIQDLDNSLCIVFRKEVTVQKWWRETRCPQGIEARQRERAEYGLSWTPARCPMPGHGAVPSAPWLPCSQLQWWNRPWLGGPGEHHGEPPSPREQPALAGASDSGCWSSSDVGNQTGRGLGEKEESASLVHGQHSDKDMPNCFGN